MKQREDEIGDFAVVIVLSVISGLVVSKGFPIWSVPTSLLAGYILILAWRGLTK